MDPSEDLRRRREQTVAALVEAINAGDPAMAADVFAAPRFELVGLNRVYNGRDEVIGYLEGRRHAFPDQTYEIIELRHADDAVIAEFWMIGTHLGNVEGLPPTGRAFRCRMAGFFIFRDEALVCQRLYFDVGTIARQLA